MKTVKLTRPLLIDTINHAAGDVVAVHDDRARELLKGGHAEEADGKGKLANPDHNALADCITPEPPGGTFINPVDAQAPNVADNPGLVALAAATANPSKARSSRVKAEDVPANSGDAPKLDPTTTANELTPKKG